MTKLVARALSLRGALVGFDDESPVNKVLYTHLLVYDFTRLYYDLLLDVLSVFSLQRKMQTPTLHFPEAPNALKNLGLTPGEYVVVHPFGANPKRSILAGELEKLVAGIAHCEPGVRIVLSGGRADSARIPESLREKVLSVAGKVSMTELATLIQQSMLYVGVDTGVTHLASVLKVRSLVIAHDGASNWLPYYNENATILYQILDDSSGIHEGRDYLESQRKGRQRYLGRVSDELIANTLARMLSRNE